jgi:hypothetical protein
MYFDVIFTSASTVRAHPVRSVVVGQNPFRDAGRGPVDHSVDGSVDRA